MKTKADYPIYHAPVTEVTLLRAEAGFATSGTDGDLYVNESFTVGETY